jgi:hypothetical protein
MGCLKATHYFYFMEMKNKICYSLLLVVLSFNGYAHLHLRGVTKDVNGNAVEYVVIGFPEKGVGTVSDRQGVFSLVIPDSLRDTGLTFSRVGYKILLLPPDSVDSVIEMEKKVMELPEISIVPQTKKTKPQWFKHGFKIPGYAYSENLGEEWEFQ